MMYYKIAIGSLKKSQVAIGNLKNKEKNKQTKKKRITKLRYGKTIISRLILHVPKNTNMLLIKRVFMSSRE